MLASEVQKDMGLNGSLLSWTPPPAVEDPTPKMADLLLAETMNKLSMKEREQVFEDVHGVADIIDETPNLVERCLTDLQLELDRIPSNEKHAYELAKSQNLEYVTNRKFRLMFLRSESFQPQLTAQRMVCFFESKLELFGPDKLSKDIQMDDLDPSDLDCFKSGHMQILPSRDRAGRTIVSCIPKLPGANATATNKVRNIWYVLMVAIQDEESQKKGMVGMIINIGPGSKVDRGSIWKGINILSHLPVRTSALHYCYDNPGLVQLALSMCTMFSGTHVRTRFRPHFGTNVECIYKLMTFGISPEALPIESTGKVKLANHKVFMAWQQAKERSINQHNSTSSTVERVVVPGRLDVLLGRGTQHRSHPGNIRFHQIIESHRERYESAAGRFEKTIIAEMLVGTVKDPNEGGGRFLAQEKDEGWVVISDKVARQKVSHAFRNLRLKPDNGSSTNPTPTLRAVVVAPAESVSNNRMGSILSRPLDEDEGCFFTPCKRVRIDDSTYQ